MEIRLRRAAKFTTAVCILRCGGVFRGMARADRRAMTDELTRLNNRRSYDADMESYKEGTLADDFVIFSVDVNGLKEANDTRGHVAGDELLWGAAQCLLAVFEPVGKVYRTGGDEFMAIATGGEPKDILEQINRASAAWRGQYVKQLSLSVGYAAHREHPELNLHGLEILADQMMYREKKRYYSEAGNDRRRNSAVSSQQPAASSQQ